MGAVNFEDLEAGGDALGGVTEAVTTRGDAGGVRGRGPRAGGKGSRTGPPAQPPSASATAPRSPVKPAYVEALRPRAPAGCRRRALAVMKSVMRAQDSACSSFQIPASSGEIRPSGTRPSLR